VIYDKALLLADGSVSEMALPFTAPGGLALLLPGHVASGTFDMLPQLLAIQQRVAPWTQLYFAPVVWHLVEGDSDGWYADQYTQERRQIGGREYYRCNGLAWQVGEVDYSVSSLAQPHLIAAIVYHELFHNISMHLPPAAHELLDQAVARSTASYPGYYGGLAEERKARLFEHVASALDEGLRLPIEPGSAEHLLARIYRGEVAREIMSPPRPKGGALRRIVSAVLP
jgi:hypothetical protein